MSLLSAAGRCLWVFALFLAVGVLLSGSGMLAGNQVSAPATTEPATQPASTQTTASTQPTAPLTAAQIDQIMSFLKASQPETYHKAMELKRSDPNKFTALINKAAPSFIQLEELQRSDPVLFKLTLQDLAYTHRSFQLANELRQPGLAPEDQQNLKQQLIRVVTEQFDLRQQIRQHELDQLTTKINDLKVQLDQREKQRESIIQQRVDDLIGNPPSADW
ncbi:MAG TPA: hypothetical protein VMG59_07355 [Phycisphaerae bacterium]|nr:hypothetical protein [Phycisphaerae bacterium]